MEPNRLLAFRDLQAEIETYTRQHGYYLIKLVDISGLRASGQQEESIAKKVFEYFDDHPWPPPDQRSQDQTWADYRVNKEVARNRTVLALVGGQPIGHSCETIPRVTAEQFFDRFDQLFEAPKTYYVGMGLGDPAYLYNDGVAIVSQSRAGLLGIVEDD